jgi:hypothetical protein
LRKAERVTRDEARGLRPTWRNSFTLPVVVEQQVEVDDRWRKSKS